MAIASVPRRRSLRRSLVQGITAAAVLAALAQALLLNLVWVRYEDRVVDRIVVDQLRRSVAMHAREPALAYPNTEDLRLYVVPGDTPPDWLRAVVERPPAEGAPIEVREIRDGEGLVHRVGAARTGDTVFLLSYDPAEHVDRIASLLAAMVAIVAVVVAASLRVSTTIADRLLAGLHRLQADVAAGRDTLGTARDGLEVEVAALADELDARGRQLAASLRKERAFAAAASHELRTPLTRIATGTEVLLALPDTPEAARRRLRTIGEAASELGRLLDVLLQVARWQPGEPAPGDGEPPRPLGEVVAACVARIEAEARAIGTSIAVTLDAPGWPVAHPDKLDVVLANLLRNAVRHGRGAPVEVIGRDGELQVLDAGPGIDAAALERAFEPFWKGGGAPDAGAAGRRADGTAWDGARPPEGAAVEPGHGGPPGLGLGLTIAERICAVAGWVLSIEPRTPHGTRARIRLSSVPIPP